jgi:hypothetical protein
LYSSRFRKRIGGPKTSEKMSAVSMRTAQPMKMQRVLDTTGD